MRRTTPRPASANTRSGIATPSENETVSTTVPASMRPVDPATMIAASTGPAQGTKTVPRASPTPNPPRSFETSRRGIHWNGRSRRCSSRGTIRATPSTASTTIPAHRRKLWGKPSAPSTSEPASVTAVKLTISPAITR
jgi:hypothetical protein